MIRYLPILAAALFITGCDADEDGLSSLAEGKWNTDTKLADSDGDGLLDGDEVKIYSTDPAVYDSDGDSYPDGFEILMGSDPLDAKSLAYKGGWPFNPEADALEESGRSGQVWSLNKTWPRQSMVDQFGDTVDIYHFANQGKPIIIDISAEWCPPCREIAGWLEGQPHPFDEYYPNVVRAVDEGEVIWITILGENMDGDPAVKRTSKDWYNDFPHPKIPVLSDTRWDAIEYADLQAWPTVFFLNENMKIKAEGQASSMEATEQHMADLGR